MKSLVAGGFSPASRPILLTRKDLKKLVNADNGLLAQPDRPPWTAEEAFVAIQRAEQARRQMRAAQRSAANSMDDSAASRERTAKAYEEAAEHRDLRDDEYLEHAARHREFAREDRLMPERLRRMAEINSIGNAAMQWDRR